MDATVSLARELLQALQLAEDRAVAQKNWSAAQEHGDAQKALAADVASLESLAADEKHLVDARDYNGAALAFEAVAKQVTVVRLHVERINEVHPTVANEPAAPPSSATVLPGTVSPPDTVPVAQPHVRESQAVLAVPLVPMAHPVEAGSLIPCASDLCAHVAVGRSLKVREFPLPRPQASLPQDRASVDTPRESDAAMPRARLACKQLTAPPLLHAQNREKNSHTLYEVLLTVSPLGDTSPYESAVFEAFGQRDADAYGLRVLRNYPHFEWLDTQLRKDAELSARLVSNDVQLPSENRPRRLSDPGSWAQSRPDATERGKALCAYLQSLLDLFSSSEAPKVRRARVGAIVLMGVRGRFVGWALNGAPLI